MTEHERALLEILEGVFTDPERLDAIPDEALFQIASALSVLVCSFIARLARRRGQEEGH